MTTDMAEASVEDTTYTYDRSQGTTSELVITSPSSWEGRTIVEVFLIFMCFLAFIANLAMLIFLLAYKQATKKTVNTFVCNQTVLDLVATFFSGVKIALMASRYLDTKTGVTRIFEIRISKSRHPEQFFLCFDT